MWDPQLAGKIAADIHPDVTTDLVQRAVNVGAVWEVCRLSLLYTILPEVSVSLFYVVLIQPLLEYIFNFLHRIL